jgi:hypothetical protein
MGTQRPARSNKPPLLATGILFALAANLLLPTALEASVGLWDVGQLLWWLTGVVAPLVAGALTALYTRQRGAMHALIGGMISVPILALFVFPGNWQLAIFAGCFCAFGGAITELFLRR